MIVLIWIARILLALFFILAAYFHGFAPLDVAAKSAHWISDISPAFRKVLGVIELAGGVGVLIPRLARPAALGLAALMCCAVAFHLSRGESHIIWLNLCLAAVAIFVAWRSPALMSRR
jgi:uncharacterized membrane protein YphA (DoxX/SURF4 family)